MKLLKNAALAGAVALCLCCLSLWASAKMTKSTSETYSKKMQGAPLLFTENKGQIADAKGNPRKDVLFTAHSGSTKIFLTASTINYQFTKVVYPKGYDRSAKQATDPEKQAALEQKIRTESYRFSLDLVGANQSPAIRKEDKNAFTESFYLPQCPEGITNVGTYGKVVYENVYPNIDWVLYTTGGHLEYDFVVKPGGDLKQIKLRINDAEKVSITGKGELLIKTTLGEVREKAPVSYANGKKIATKFKQNSDGTIGYVVDAIPQDATLTIDPSVSWATYFGGNTVDVGDGIAVDGSGNVYLAGYTTSTTGLASGGWQNTFGGVEDAYLAKFNSAGTALLWATYYGGTGTDLGYSCAVDNLDNVYLAGYTTSTATATMTTAGAQQTVFAGTQDAFLVKFNSAGVRQWGTFYGGIGGTGVTQFRGCAVDASNNVYVAGYTTCTVTGTIATSGTAQPAYGTGATYNAFVAKFNSTGSRQWGTYYGGTTGLAQGLSCASDAAGNVYMSGITSYSATGTVIATTGTAQTSFGGGSYDAFLVKLNGTTGARLWGTYYGGTGLDYGYSCATSGNNVYLAGYTASSVTGTAIATAGSHQGAFGGGSYDAYLVKLNGATGARLWGTYYGGSNIDEALGCATDLSGNVYITGLAESTNGTANSVGFDTVLNGTENAFIAQFDSTGVMQWGSYFGGTITVGESCAADNAGNVYFGGYTTYSVTGSNVIATTGSAQTAYGGGAQDGFLVKLINASITTGNLPGSPFCPGGAVNVPFTAVSFNSGNIFAAQLSDASGSFATPVVIGTLSATTSGTITATIPAGTASGNGYRIRIVSTLPAMTAADNGSDLTINATATVTIGGSTAVMSGTATPLTFAGTPSATVYYTDGTLTYTVSLNSSGSATVSVTPTVTTTYSVTSTTTTAGCPAAITGQAATITIGAPTAAISGSTGICSTLSAILTFTGSPGSTISYNANGIAQPNVTLPGSGSYTLSVSPATTTTYSLTAIASSGYTGPLSSSAVITVSVSPAIASIYADAAVCAGGTLNLNATVSPGYSSALNYMWSGPGGYSRSTSSSVTTNSVTETSMPVSPASPVFTLTVTDGNGCAATGTNTVSTSVDSPSPGTITGTTMMCFGTSTTLTDLVTGGTWISSNSGIASISATTATTATINSAGLGSASITYAVNNSCGTYSTSATVVVNPMPAPTISGTTSILYGGSATITFTGNSGDIIYYWNGASTVTKTLAATTGTVTVTPTVTTTYSVTSATSAAGCSQTISGQTATVTVGPMPTAAIMGTATICATSGTVISFSGTPGATLGYSANGTTQTPVVLSGAGLYSITVTPAATTTYSLTTITSGPYTGPLSGSAVVSVHTLPLITSTIADATACIGSVLHLSTSVTPGSSPTLTYLWNGPGGYTMSTTTAITTNSVTESPVPATPVNPVFTLTVTDGFGCTAAGTHTVTTAVSSYPSAISVGTPTVCSGSTTVFSDPASGGTWSSGSATVASVDGGGTVLGLVPGSATISYSTGGCAVTASVTVAASSLTITTIAGTGVATSTGDGAAATAATINDPAAVAIDASGNIYIADRGANKLRKITASTGNISTIATGLSGPSGIAVDGSGNVYIANSFSNQVSKYTASSGTTAVIAGTGTGSYSGDGGAPAAATLQTPCALALDASGDLYIADYSNQRIRKITFSTNKISTYAGNGTAAFGGDGGLATSANLRSPNGLAFDNSGNLYICDENNYRIRKVNTSGIISTVAGGSTTGYSGDFGPATAAYINCTNALNYSANMACDASGNLFIVDYSNNRIREIRTDGNITTYAGNGSATYSGDGGNALYAGMNPDGVAVDASGNLYVSDYNNRIRKISPAGPAVAAITGPSAFCVGAPVALSDATGSGVWSSVNSSIATVDASGNVTGIASGTVTLKYTVGTGCNTNFWNFTDTVNTGSPLPGAITGTVTSCPGLSTTLSDPTATAGGLWSSSNAAIASITAATGIVTSITSGTTAITYTAANGCGTVTPTVTYTVNPLPVVAPITGTTNLCLGSSPSSATLLDATSAGGTFTWSSSNNAIATVGASSGIVTGVSQGSNIISYKFNDGFCTNTVTATVNVVNTPAAPAVTPSVTAICAGSAPLLLTATGGATADTAYQSQPSYYGVLPLSGHASFSVAIANISIPSGATITSVTVTFQINSTYASLLEVNLKAPNNNVLNLINLKGLTGSGSTNFNCGISSSAITALPTGSSSYTSTYKADGISGVGPAGFVSNVTTWSGLYSVPNGTWSLDMYNSSTSSTPAAYLYAYSLLINYTMPASYTWSGTGLYTTSSGSTLYTAGTPTTTVYAQPAATTIYTITASNGTCTNIASQTFTVNPLPSVASVTASAASLCVGTPVNFSASVTPSTGLNYHWSGPAGYSSSAIAPSFTPTAATASGTYSLSVTNTSTSCVSPSVGTTSVAVGASPGITGLVVSAASLCSGNTYTLTPSGLSGGVGTAQYMWSGPGLATTSTSVTPLTFTPAATGAGPYNVSVSYPGSTGCGTVSANSGSVTVHNQQWTGASSADWNTAANWGCGTVPLVTQDIVIPAASAYTLAPVLTGMGYARIFSISPTAALTLIGGSLLSVAGNLINNGTVTGDGVLTLNGSSAQAISGNGAVSNLTLDNTAGAAIGTSGDTVGITGTLLLNNGTLSTNNRLMLISNTTDIGGRIGPITGTGGISGNVVVQQYVPGHRAYRFWAHPFNGPVSLSQLQNYVDVTGTGGSGSGFTPTATNAPSAFYYNPAISNSILGSDPGWVAYSNISNTINQYEGIRIFVRGAKGEGLTTTFYTPDATTIRMYGAVNTGNLNVPMSAGTMSVSGTPAQLYNMIGNPYPSPVDIGAVINAAHTAGSIYGTAFYVWDPYGGSGTGAYIVKPISMYPSYILQANASFQVQAMYNGATLPFTESNKSATPSEALLRSSAVLGNMVKLSVYDESYHPWDAMYIDFNDAASDKEEGRYDAGKDSNPALNFYSISSDNAKLSIDSRPYSAGKVIPLGLTSSYAQDFIIKVDEMTALAGGNLVYLHDKYLRQYTLMQQGAEYKFTITRDSATQGENRFELGLQSETATTLNVQKGLDIQMMPNPASDEVTIIYSAAAKEATVIRIINMEGTPVLAKNLGIQQSGSVSIGVNDLAAGVYMVEVVSGNNKVIKGLTIE